MSANADAIVKSAITLAQAIIATDALVEHKRLLLSDLIWKVSEADGKYNVRYWSEGVQALVRKHGSIEAVMRVSPLPLRHEHVNTRKALVDAMLRDPACVTKVLGEEAFACLVTTDEHGRLKDQHAGFERYKAAGIRVWDNVTKRWLW